MRCAWRLVASGANGSKRARTSAEENPVLQPPACAWLAHDLTSRTTSPTPAARMERRQGRHLHCNPRRDAICHPRGARGWDEPQVRLCAAARDPAFADAWEQALKARPSMKAARPSPERGQSIDTLAYGHPRVTPRLARPASTSSTWRPADDLRRAEAARDAFFAGLAAGTVRVARSPAIARPRFSSMHRPVIRERG